MNIISFRRFGQLFENKCYRIQNQTVELFVQVKPQARKTILTGISSQGLIHISIHAAPVEDKANQELIRFLAELFSLPKSSVKIIRGYKAKKKTIVIPNKEHVLKQIEVWRKKYEPSGNV